MKCLQLLLVAIISLLMLSTDGWAQKKAPAGNQAEKDIAVVKNGIRFKATGLKVSEAYLFFDDESLVPENNKVALNQNVNLLLIIEEGWNVPGGRVYPGSKQVIKLNTGVEILDSGELFAAFDETGVSPEDARYITLNAVITELKDKRNHVIVNFRVWDKKGSGEITGSYKLYLK